MGENKGEGKKNDENGKERDERKGEKRWARKCRELKVKLREELKK